MIIIGAGLAGVVTALRLKEVCPHLHVRVAEMASGSMESLRRMGPVHLEPLLDRPLEASVECVFRGQAFSRQLMHRFDGMQLTLLLERLGLARKGLLKMPALADRLDAALQQAGVEVVPERKAVEVAPRGSDGLFRVWFEVGNPWEGQHLVLAMGGTWHRGFGWLENWGHSVRRTQPAFLSLRLSESRWRGLNKVPWPGRTAVWIHPGSGARLEAEGAVYWRYPFLEGSAIAGLTARAGEALRSNRTSGRLEIVHPDPRQDGLDLASLRRKVQEGGSKTVAQDAPEGFHSAAWGAIVRGARIQPRDTWKQLSVKQVQTLASHLARLTVKFSGFRQWKDEFSMEGGVDLDAFEPGSLQSRRIEGLFVVGEMLDLDGAPGGTNLHLAMASGVVAAQGIAHLADRS